MPAREGNAVATSRRLNAVAFQPSLDLATAGKSAAITALNDAIDAWPAPRKALASDAGLTEQTFSKIVNGKQGDLFELLYLLPGDLRADVLRRLQELEHVDPEALAAEHLLVAAVRFLRIAKLPARAVRLATADLTDVDEEVLTR